MNKLICAACVGRALLHRSSTTTLTFINARTIHISGRCQAPIVPWAVLASIGRKALHFGAVLFGRRARNWYKSLPPEQRLFYTSHARTHRRKYWYAGAAGAGLVSGYVISHLERTPETGRIRFVAFTPYQYRKLCQFTLDSVLASSKRNLVPENDWRYIETEALVGRILYGNKDKFDLENFDWQVYVVKDTSENAFVVPTGQIFVNTGMIAACANADQLGVVLSHEIAHAVLRHGIEHVSVARLTDWFMIVLLAAIWTIIPNDGIAAVFSWYSNTVMNILLHLPYSRTMEREADQVGLMMAARACFDVRQAPEYWANLAKRAESGQAAPQPPEFLSTHPAHQGRVEHLLDYLHEALTVRRQCDCYPLDHGL